MVVGKNDKKVSACIFSTLSFITAAVLLVGGLGLWMAGSSAVSMVNKGLVDEKMYFPPASPAFPKVEKYAGKQVTDGGLAKAYADGLLAEQLKMVGNGYTSAQVGDMLAADPQNVQLQQQSMTMFQIDTSETLLLVAGYQPWMLGNSMKTGGMVALALAALLFVVGVVEWMRYKRP